MLIHGIINIDFIFLFITILYCFEVLLFTFRYADMIHRQIPNKIVSFSANNQKLTIRQFFNTVVCAACKNQTQKDICMSCMAKPSQTITILHEKLRWLKRTHYELTVVHMKFLYIFF